MDKCNNCNKEESKATKYNTIGMTWLDKYQYWICDSCLTSEKNKIIHG